MIIAVEKEKKVYSLNRLKWCVCIYIYEVRFGKSTNGKKIFAQAGATTLQLRLLLIHGRTI